MVCVLFLSPAHSSNLPLRGGLQRSPFGEANVALPKGNKGYLQAKARDEPKRDSRTGVNFRMRKIKLENPQDT